MATISTRVDDQLKSDAEKIADEIGIPVSTAINVFLKRFVANRGFPFNVISTNNIEQVPTIDVNMFRCVGKKSNRRSK